MTSPSPTPAPLPSLVLPLRITPRPTCFAVEDATGRYVFSVGFDLRPERDDGAPRFTREKALEAARRTMRALTEPAGPEGQEH